MIRYRRLKKRSRASACIRPHAAALGKTAMPEPSYFKQTGSFRIQDNAGLVIEIKQISRFIGVSDQRSKGREWSENTKKRFFGPDNREGDFVEGSSDKFAFFDEPDQLFTKLDGI